MSNHPLQGGQPIQIRVDLGAGVHLHPGTLQDVAFFDGDTGTLTLDVRLTSGEVVRVHYRVEVDEIQVVRPGFGWKNPKNPG